MSATVRACARVFLPFFFSPFQKERLRGIFFNVTLGIELVNQGVLGVNDVTCHIA